MTAKEAKAYDTGYANGLQQGRIDAIIMKEDADGCLGCAFEYVEEWELPCSKCKRNCKDYWRMKVEECKYTLKQKTENH